MTWLEPAGGTATATGSRWVVGKTTIGPMIGPLSYQITARDNWVNNAQRAGQCWSSGAVEGASLEVTTY